MGNIRNVCIKFTMKMYNELLNIIYPKRCPVCDNVLSRQGILCCDECADKLIVIKEPICKKCGKPLFEEDIEYCFDCSKRKKYFIEGRAVYLYDELMKKSISNFKYNSKREFATFYIQSIVDNMGDYIEEKNIDLIVPVPIHKERLMIRGFNQANILAKGIGKKLDIEVCEDLILRDKKTIAQKELSNVERYKNLDGVFVVNNKYLNSKKVYMDKFKDINNILIIDDIYTTGATISSCAKELMKYKDLNVYFITLSIGQGH